MTSCRLGSKSPCGVFEASSDIAADAALRETEGIEGLLMFTGPRGGATWGDARGAGSPWQVGAERARTRQGPSLGSGGDNRCEGLRSQSGVG